jgi:hypothetical protein
VQHALILTPALSILFSAKSPEGKSMATILVAVLFMCFINSPQ